MKASSVLAVIAAFLSTGVSAQTVYLIRHGEKPSSGNGLSTQGQQRAQCLKNVFGPNSQYNVRAHCRGVTPPSSIQYIMAETPKSDGSRQRPLDTVQPLAAELGLSVDTSCDRDDSDCVADTVSNYSGEGNILICWEHDALTDIVQALGDDNPPDYPDDSFNLIWTDPSPYNTIVSETSEDCPGLDSS